MIRFKLKGLVQCSFSGCQATHDGLIEFRQSEDRVRIEPSDPQTDWVYENELNRIVVENIWCPEHRGNARKDA